MRDHERPEGRRARVRWVAAPALETRTLRRFPARLGPEWGAVTAVRTPAYLAKSDDWQKRPWRREVGERKPRRERPATEVDRQHRERRPGRLERAEPEPEIDLDLG
jgi:hypothetical protein